MLIYNSAVAGPQNEGWKNYQETQENLTSCFS